MSVTVKKGSGTSISEPILYLVVCGNDVHYITHEDADGYQEGGIFRTFEFNAENVAKHNDLVEYVNDCIYNDKEKFVVRSNSLGLSDLLKVYR